MPLVVGQQSKNIDVFLQGVINIPDLQNLVVSMIIGETFFSEKRYLPLLLLNKIVQSNSVYFLKSSATLLVSTSILLEII